MLHLLLLPLACRGFRRKDLLDAFQNSGTLLLGQSFSRDGGVEVLVVLLRNFGKIAVLIEILHIFLLRHDGLG